MYWISQQNQENITAPLCGHGKKEVYAAGA